MVTKLRMDSITRTIAFYENNMPYTLTLQDGQWYLVNKPHNIPMDEPRWQLLDTTVMYYVTLLERQVYFDD